MTDVQTSSGGRPSPSTAMVSADQLTILGNGTTDLPLTAGSGGSSFLATFLADASFPPALGQAVVVGGGAPSVGLCNVLLGIGSLPISGIVIALRDVVQEGSSITAEADIQSAAIVTLTGDDWDGVTGDSGGLTPGGAYYLHPTTVGMITSTKPTAIGQVVAQLGVAITTTQLAVYLPVVPITITS